MHLMRSRRIDRPHRRKQHASLHGMFDDHRHESDAQFAHFQSMKDSTRTNAISQSIYNLQKRVATPVVINGWTNRDGSTIHRQGFVNMNIIESTNNRLIRV